MKQYAIPAMKKSILVVVVVLLASLTPGVPVGANVPNDGEFTTLGFLAGEGLASLDLPDEPDGEVRVVAAGRTIGEGNWAAIIYNGLPDQIVTAATVTPVDADRPTLKPSDLLVPGVIPPGEIGFVISDVVDRVDDPTALSLSSGESFDAEIDVDATIDLGDLPDALAEDGFEAFAPFPVLVRQAAALQDTDGVGIIAVVENIFDMAVTPAVLTVVCLDEDGVLTGAVQHNTRDSRTALPPRSVGAVPIDLRLAPTASCETVIVTATSTLNAVD